MIPENQLPHPSTDDMPTRFVEHYELDQGRSHKQPWQPVAITLAIVAAIIGTLWVTL